MSKIPLLDPEMLSLEGREAHYRWELFEENPTGPYAMDAIREIVKKGLPIPEELIPWVEAACNSWEETKGNRQWSSTKDTDVKWSQAIMAVWRKYMGGSKIDDALEAVAPQFSCSASSLRSKYYSPEGKRCRDYQKEHCQVMRNFYTNFPAWEKEKFPDRTPDTSFPEKAKALEKQFPRLFKDSGY